MAMDKPLQLKLNRDLWTLVEVELTNRCLSSVQGSQERDEECLDFDDQINGRPIMRSRPRWKGACDLADTTTKKLAIQVRANIEAALRRDKPIISRAVDPNQRSKERLQESWFAAKWQQFRIHDTVMSPAIANTCRDRTVPVFTGWKQELKQVRTIRYYIEGDDMPYDEMPMTDLPVRAQPELEWQVRKDGFDFRVIDLANFYMYPATSVSPEEGKAIATFERRLLTEEQLLDGIDNNGWDEDTIMDIIAAGPSVGNNDTNFSENRNEWDGVSDIGPDGFYECFLMFGKLPLLWDSNRKPQLPEYLHHDEVIAWLNPKNGKMFGLDFSPYPWRPYICYNILKNANNFLGDSVCSLVRQHYEEATADIRLTMDSRDIQLAPIVKCSQEWMANFQNFSVYPGCKIPFESSPDEWSIQVLPQTYMGGIEVQRWHRGEMESIVGAQGYGELDPKQRKATEIQNVMNAIAVKHDLMLQTFQSSNSELAERMIQLWVHFKPGEVDLLFDGNDIQTVGSDDLSGEFMYIPNGSTRTATPEMKAQLAEVALNTVRSSAGFTLAVQHGYLEAEKTLLTEVLSALGS